MSTLFFGCGYLGQRAGVLLGRSGERVFGTVRSEARAAEIAALAIEPVIADVLDRDSLRGCPRPRECSIPWDLTGPPGLPCDPYT